MDSEAEEEVRAAIARPAILRFASDSFMDELNTLLANEPSRVAELLAVPEEWRAPAPSVSPPSNILPQFARRLNRSGLASVVPAGAETQAAAAPRTLFNTSVERLLLYQPAHLRYYLVAACLVCPGTGMPDCTVDSGKSEQASFVVRRLRPKTPPTSGAEPDPPNPVNWQDDWDEYAFVKENSSTAWTKLKYADMPPDEEERLPLFPLSYQAADGRKRRLFAGLVPVSRREAYLGAPLTAKDSRAEAGEEPLDPRLALLLADVIAPWNSLIDQASAFHRACDIPTKDNHPNSDDAKPLLQKIRSGIQSLSWYILLDFLKYLNTYLPDVGEKISGESPELSDAEDTLVAALEDYSPTLPSNFQQDIAIIDPPYSLCSSLYDALAETARLQNAQPSLKDQLEAMTVEYDRTNDHSAPAWPHFLFPLTDPALIAKFTVTTETTESDLISYLTSQVKALRLKTPGDQDSFTGIRLLYDLVAEALKKYPLPATTPPAPLGAQKVVDAGQTAWFVLRCIYECPSCGPLRPTVVSQPTVVFQMASFFEPRAPARPIRIALPVNTTPAGFRQFAKNTAFMVSDVLACQKQRMGKTTFGDLVLSVLPWPFHKDLPADSETCTPGIGFICSLSIPIITICALILLMIIVSLLDIVFHWIPYFILCFPLPGFSAKKGNVS